MPAQRQFGELLCLGRLGSFGPFADEGDEELPIGRLGALVAQSDLVTGVFELDVLYLGGEGSWDRVALVRDVGSAALASWRHLALVGRVEFLGVLGEAISLLANHLSGDCNRFSD